MHRLLCLGLLLAATPAAAADDPGAPPPPPSSPPSLTPPSDPESPPPPPSPPPAAVHVDHAYVGAGPALGVAAFFTVAMMLEGGVKLPDLPLWVRGAVAAGSSFDFEGGGPLRRGGIGLEGRACSGRVVCGFLDFEVGYQTEVWESSDDPTEHHHGAIVGGRAGLDVGASVRFRAALEIFRYRHASDVMGSSVDWEGGGSISIGLAYQF
jgi:hypothetical protein